MRKPARLERRRSSARAARAVALLLRGDVLVVAERRDHGAAAPAHGTISPACLRTSSSSPHQGDVTGDERRAVAGQVGLLATASRPRAGPRGCRRITRGSRIAGASARRPAGLPAELGVALVARDDRADARRAQATDLGQVLDAEHPPVGVAGRVHPDQRPGRPSGQLRRGRRRRPGSRRPAAAPDVVGRVGDLGVHDDVARAEPEQRRQQRDELLGADGRQHAVRVERRARRGGGEPVGDRLAQLGRAVGLRVARGVGRRGQRVAGRPRASGRPACRPTGRRCRPGARARRVGVRRERVPREVRGASRPRLGPSLVVLLRRERRDDRVVLGDDAELGRAAGEPRSSKNSTLAL